MQNALNDLGGSGLGPAFLGNMMPGIDEEENLTAESEDDEGDDEEVCSNVDASGVRLDGAQLTNKPTRKPYRINFPYAIKFKSEDTQHECISFQI